jgi:hypothetical protein
VLAAPLQVYGEALCNCMLSRMPRLTLTFTTPHIIEDAALHVCVRRAAIGPCVVCLGSHASPTPLVAPRRTRRPTASGGSATE